MSTAGFWGYGGVGVWVGGRVIICINKKHAFNIFLTPYGEGFFLDTVELNVKYKLYVHQSYEHSSCICYHLDVTNVYTENCRYDIYFEQIPLHMRSKSVL